MNIAYQQAVKSARATDWENRNRIRGWTVFQSEGVTSLLTLAYREERRVTATVVWSGADAVGAMQLLADHLNEEAGGGPDMVDTLLEVYRARSPRVDLLACLAAPSTGFFN